RGWYRVNPFAGLLDAFRVIALDGRIPPWVDIWPALVWSLGLLALGVVYFRAEEPTMADYV
ncbi:MAG: ABC transporter permease, partial [Actinobacteria bacterium]|nr:ABC transporter permease [Actinomycetota bacterium]